MAPNATRRPLSILAQKKKKSALLTRVFSLYKMHSVSGRQRIRPALEMLHGAAYRPALEASNKSSMREPCYIVHSEDIHDQGGDRRVFAKCVDHGPSVTHQTAGPHAPHADQLFQIDLVHELQKKHRHAVVGLAARGSSEYRQALHRRR